MRKMLEIKDLHAAVDGTEILKGIDLTIGAGEVHAIMGPNGSGKSTLSYVLSGRDGYDVTAGSITYRGQDLLELSIEERATEGLFLGFQYPVELPGVSSTTFLKTALNAVRRQRGEEELDAVQFMKRLRSHTKTLNISDDMLRRGVNEGFSGGEKKRNEIMQLIMLEPKLAILDESDSGLDVDALQVVANGVNSQRDGERSFIVVTHYQRLLDFIEPDYVHILAQGKIVKSGGPELAKEVEASGYAWLGQADEGEEA